MNAFSQKKRNKNKQKFKMTKSPKTAISSTTLFIWLVDAIITLSIDLRPVFL